MFLKGGRRAMFLYVCACASDTFAHTTEHCVCGVDIFAILPLLFVHNRRNACMLITRLLARADGIVGRRADHTLARTC